MGEQRILKWLMDPELGKLINHYVGHIDDLDAPVANMVDAFSNNLYTVTLLRGVATPPPNPAWAKDKISWRWYSQGRFSVSDTYSMLSKEAWNPTENAQPS